MGKRTANTRDRVVHVIFVIFFFIGVSIFPATSWPLPQAPLTDLPGSTNRRPGSPVLDLGGPKVPAASWPLPQARRSRCRDFSFPPAVSLLAGNTTPDCENYQRTEVRIWLDSYSG